ncbi:hypothetical protein BVG79_00566 [Ketogulonicigenium robustum]|uniref:Cytochrome C oxidase assembly protein n=1 Tax=Ketogulonicigenium robustum TaxID=92947 RepID=A0A1W6NXE4_9RHOB|nr:hypothetical protein [Ketogulonicigenium robustum]ARO13918.1 hypothetical protein BVG79_00566 [Ketogulonicigenium robustum]
MAIRVEHELHQRRKGRNYGLFGVLFAFVIIVFGLTIVKVSTLDDISQFEAYDHVARPQIVPGQITGGAQ